jgi:hypothetical protein
MRLPPGVGATYHAMKWALFVAVFGLFAGNLIVPAGALFFLIFSNGPWAGILTFLTWLTGTGVMLWLVARHGRKTRREGRENRHTQLAVRAAGPPPSLAADYELIDIGVKPLRSGSRLVRDEALPDDLPEFFPNVRLWMRRSYAGRLMFEFVDDNGHVIRQFTRSRWALLIAGYRNITFKQPIQLDERAELPEGIWQMRVWLGDNLLAVHRLPWYQAGQDDEPSDDFVYPHAHEAAQQAGLSLDEAALMLTDIGLLVTYGDERPPEVFRTEPIAIDATAVQPFIRLHLPKKAVGGVRFALHAPDGTSQLDHTERHEYTPGDNLIAAASGLRVSDEMPLDAMWELHVYIGGTLIARHRFDWQRSIPDDLNPLEHDGEITDRLQDRLIDTDEPISLHDLLDDQRRHH